MAVSAKPQRETVLITGASSGIGEALARCAAADGCALVLVARSADKLEALARELTADPGVPVRVIPAVLNVASIAAFQPVPMLATYAATKAFVLSLTESLAEELAGTGVTITALCPGITATAMLTGASESNPRLGKLPRFVVGEVDRVARDGWRASRRGQVIKVPGAANLAATIGGRATPKWILRRIAGAVTRKAM